MLIIEQAPRHSMIKVLDYYEMEFRTRILDIENHMTDDNNPHHVTSDQVQVTGSVSSTVYDHIINTGIHHYYSEMKAFITTGAIVKAASGLVAVSTLKGTVYEYVYVDGILKALDILGTEMDYSVVRNDNYPPGPCVTEIRFHDPSNVLEDDAVVQILYQEQL